MKKLLFIGSLCISSLHPIPAPLMVINNLLGDVTELTDIVTNAESLAGGRINAHRAQELRMEAYKLNKVVESVIALINEGDGRNRNYIHLIIKVTKRIEELLLELKKYYKTFVS